MSDLKPCPFCGCEAKLRFFHIKPANAPELKQWSIEHECVAMRSAIFSNECEAEAIEAWNTRHERTINLTEAVDAICGQMCGDGWDWRMRAETVVRTIAEMCGAKVIE